MENITLNAPILLERLATMAKENGVSSETLLIQAINELLDKQTRKKIHQESDAFNKMHHRLLQTHAGQYVALHNGQVVGQAVEARELYIEMRQKFGQIPVLIRKVSDQPERQLIFRSPRLSKVKP